MERNARHSNKWKKLKQQQQQQTDTKQQKDNNKKHGRASKNNVKMNTNQNTHTTIVHGSLTHSIAHLHERKTMINGLKWERTTNNITKVRMNNISRIHTQQGKLQKHYRIIVLLDIVGIQLCACKILSFFPSFWMIRNELLRCHLIYVYLIWTP